MNVIILVIVRYLVEEEEVLHPLPLPLHRLRLLPLHQRQVGSNTIETRMTTSISSEALLPFVD